MNQDIENVESPETGKLPTGLKVLTILTFIGCGLGAIYTLCIPMLNDFFMKYLNEQLSSGKDLTAKQIASMEQAKGMIEMSQQHMIPLMVVGGIGIVLCFVGALWMRKLKKDGFWLYVAGELAPIIGVGFILGFDFYTSVGNIVSAVIPVVFVLLYSAQRKHLTR